MPSTRITPLIAPLFLIALAVYTATTASAVRMLLQEQSPGAAAVTPTATSSSTGNSTDDLIFAACHRAEYQDVCYSSLRSNPSSKGASNFQDLATISLDMAIAHAGETLILAQHLAGDSAAKNDDIYITRCLRDCVDQYGDAIADLGQSKDALQQAVYDTVNAQVSGAMSDAETCEDGFTDKPGYNSPLTDRNGYFHKLCSNSLAIASLLAV